jgi:hypothetical protein
MSTYPVLYEQDHQEHQSRLTTFFRALMVIPHAIWACLYGIAFVVAAIGAWFAIVFTGRFPQGLYDFCAGFLRYVTRLIGYIYLLTDRFPPFDGGEHPDYPVRLRIGPPKAEYSRLKTFFRPILAIPVYLIAYVLQIWAGLLAIAAWFVIVFTGRLPAGIFDLYRMPVAYITRANSYYYLLTEAWPPLDDGADRLPQGPEAHALPQT